MEEDAKSGDTVVLEDEERERVDTRLYPTDQELDQLMNVASPEDVARPEPDAGTVAEEVQGMDPLDNITMQPSQEAPAEHTPSVSQVELLAAGEPEFYTPSVGERFGTDDIPLTEEGIVFEFAPPAREQEEEVPPMAEKEEGIPLDHGDQQGQEPPQGEEGIQRDTAQPLGQEEGMGETKDVAPTIVNLDSEGEGDDIPPLSNKNLELAEGDGSSGNEEARASTLPLDVPAIQAVQGTQPPPVQEEIGVEEIDE